VESPEVEKLVNLLKQYISTFNARALVLRALRENGIDVSTATRHSLRQCSATLRRGVELFVAPYSREDALRNLAQFCGSDSLRPDACSLSVETEMDVSKARSEARRICSRFGAPPFTMQKVATIVSELARNIVLYAKRGTIEIVPVLGSQRKLLIRAFDQGPGIPNIDKILSGQYQSKTGLGRGLSGSKRLADRFDISTGSAGTHVTAEVGM
jgi:serine/threonine-protein kinase RsbT